MIKSTRAVITIASLTVSAAAFAAGGTAPGFYLGGGYTGATVDLDEINKDADVGVLFGRAGFQINQNVAIEARLGSGVDDDHIHFGPFSAFNAKVEVEDLYGAYLKAGLPLQQGFYPYALLGVTHGKVKVSGNAGSDSSSSSDLSYGLGIDYWFNQQISAGLEYAKFYDKDDVEVDGWTIGLNYKF